MKVILLQHVKKIGQKGDVIDVSDGYAQNALFPKKLAIPATQKALADVQKKREEEIVSKKKQTEALLSAIKRLDAKTITLKEAVNEKNGLYKAINKTQLASLLTKESGVEIDTQYIKQPDMIKEAGVHEVLLGAFGQQGTVSIVIEKKT